MHPLTLHLENLGSGVLFVTTGWKNDVDRVSRTGWGTFMSLCLITHLITAVFNTEGFLRVGERIQHHP